MNKCHWSIYLTFADVAQVEQEEEESPSTAAIRHPRKVSPEMDDNLEDFEMISESELAEVSPWLLPDQDYFFRAYNIRMISTSDLERKTPLFTAWIGILFRQLFIHGFQSIQILFHGTHQALNPVLLLFQQKFDVI